VQADLISEEMCSLADTVISLRAVAVKIDQNGPRLVRRVLSRNVNLESIDDASKYDRAIEEAGIGLARLTSCDSNDYCQHESDEPENSHGGRSSS
jgi:hypothetical protein